ncbi:bile acid:sodium symporter family protein [Pontibacter akesuensis]|uniref:Solute carrier family 10 (Sodium/bile acid cotransporter), member 7 n=1 Tax=Pontibacter akesuensis TaxID=388950 RepID=A0A1I7KMD9_9BACT|nr:bile acid:sodium symporter family protein [Pontibacter akesuensis]GHA77615.1 transporter [Pontibacter akesuensis]SFU98579.1 solute carrier family 10 (sodium/bile acid cotransporter), member 7 [Pontibacter akesuensis]
MNNKQEPVGLIPRAGALAARVGLDWFLLALIGMIVLAYAWPQLGVDREPVSLGDVANYGVSLIFFFYGLRLSPEKLKTGLSHWRLHAVVQLSTFVLFPLLILPLHGFFAGTPQEMLWLGVFYLAALPSTVSSSVVMVSIAGGNIPGAIFNASISSLMGIFITPLWMGLFLTTSGEGFDIWSVMGKLVLQVLLPVVLGIVLHRFWGGFAERNKGRLRVFDQLIILLIVYTSFCESFARNMFSGFRVTDLLLLGGAMIGLFFLVYGIIYGVTKLLGFNRENQITAIFCGSKKSLVHGTVMSKVLFPGATVVGIILLPIMLYHALQLLAASIIAQREARKAG